MLLLPPSCPSLPPPARPPLLSAPIALLPLLASIPPHLLLQHSVARLAFSSCGQHGTHVQQALRATLLQEGDAYFDGASLTLTCAPCSWSFTWGGWRCFHEHLFFSFSGGHRGGGRRRVGASSPRDDGAVRKVSKRVKQPTHINERRTKTVQTCVRRNRRPLLRKHMKKALKRKAHELPKVCQTEKNRLRFWSKV